jgi:hypothetical protein
MSSGVSAPSSLPLFAPASRVMDLSPTQIHAGNPILTVYHNREKNFAFIEFRTVEETSNAIALDGAVFNGVAVRVRRPNDYNAAAGGTFGSRSLGRLDMWLACRI